MRPPSNHGWGERLVPPAEGHSKFAQMRAAVNGTDAVPPDVQGEQKPDIEVARPLSHIDAYARWQKEQEDKGVQ